jgi:roadblock/LC7 domain-containing protein
MRENEGKVRYSAAMGLRSLLFGGLLLFGIARGTAGAPAITLEEKSLGDAAAYEGLKTLTFSTDSRHLVFLGLRNSKQFVVQDGVQSGPFDWVVPDSFSGPMNLSRLAFITQNGNEMSVHIDGQVVGSGYYLIGNNRINFSPDGKHFAFSVHRGESTAGRALVVRDGVEGKAYAAASAVPIFSPDSAHLAYAAALDSGKICAVLDGKEQTPYDQIVPGTLVFSPDSKHLAYTAAIGKKVAPVIDGQVGKSYDAMRLTASFSPDSSHVVYIAVDGKQSFVVLDGVEGPKFDTFTDGSLVFSPDSKHVAYAARTGKRWPLMLDGKEQFSTDAIAGESIHFSPDSAHLACVGITGNQRFIVLDGKQQKTAYDNILWPGPLFSPDSKRIALAGTHGDHFVASVEEVEGLEYDDIVELAFSPDSRHVTYRAVTKGQIFQVVDGKPFGPFTNSSAIAFSPDSTHFAWTAMAGTKAQIMIDGADAGGNFTLWVKGSRPNFADADNIDFLMQRDQQLIQVRAAFPPTRPIGMR